ncbi:OsmC family protein [Neobacillus vireti]|uniref:OsmC family protein n=1 Tax=Neobacillus vireti LMG 21834 TaxID=1131730 RepID=A0AB94IL66_9BACI|nr:OsmC family protein [Neobacillus vireti]ETI67784.1 OsmC family protein [Neobacillus vireti LMG 21834]KLT18575.1 osmotically inducible protein C [Neobacillus vireti]
MGQMMDLKVEGKGTGMRLDAVAGKHKIAIDEPVSFGGKDSAIDPLSTFLSSLIACENVMAQLIAQEMKFDLQGISFNVEGSLDLAGLMGDLSVKPYFQQVTVKAVVETSEPQERIDELQKAVDLRCPVFRTIKDAGIPVENQWVKAAVIA